MRRSIRKVNGVTEAGKPVVAFERLAQCQECRLPGAMTGSDLLDSPFIPQGFCNTLNLRFLRHHQMQASENAIHALLDRPARGKNALDARCEHPATRINPRDVRKASDSSRISRVPGRSETTATS